MTEHVLEHDTATLRSWFRDPAAWPDSLRADAAAAEVVQTHLSLVVLCGDRVFKLKRPVALPFCDLSERSRREELCHEEVRINRRLAPDVYHGVTWLYLEDGRPNFAGRGEAIEPAVEMARLPQDRMLDDLLAAEGVGDDEIAALGVVVGRFHRTLVEQEDGCRPEVREAADPQRLARFARANFEETAQALERARVLAASRSGGAAVLALADALAPVLDRLETRCRDDFAAHAERLEHRADAAGRERRIVEGHGDLHCRNICMTQPPTVYDALEFDLGLRALDLSAELAFLTMDLRYRGQASLASVFVESWRQAFALPDPDLDALLPTMERYRAMVRGKISAFLLADEEVDDEARAHAVDSLRQHVLLAVASAVGEDRTQSRTPLWIAVTGTPASGKSTLCRELARVSGGAWTWISTDRERKRLAGVAATRTLAAACYSEEWNERTYRAVLDTAASSRAPVCLLDGNYATAACRSVLTERARAAGVELRLVWLHADEAVVRERLARRAEAPEESESDADVAVWQAACARAEVPDPSTAWHVATDAPETALRVARHLIADVGRPAG